MDKFITLIEAARDIRTDLESLIRSAACGDLTVSVIANYWAVRRDEDAGVRKLNGWVYLIQQDLLHGVGSEFTPVRQVREPDTDEIVRLKKVQKVGRGALYMTAKELDRYRREHALALEFDMGNAPFMNSDHDWYSTELAYAVEVWMAIFANDEFEPRKSTTKQYAERWLRKNRPNLSDSAKDRIATLVNPDTAKSGGVPKTLSE